MSIDARPMAARLKCVIRCVSLSHLGQNSVDWPDQTWATLRRIAPWNGLLRCRPGLQSRGNSAAEDAAAWLDAVPAIEMEYLRIRDSADDHENRVGSKTSAGSVAVAYEACRRSCSRGSFSA